MNDTLLERFWRWLAWRLPQRLVYWAALRLIAHGTTGKWSDEVVPEARAMEMIQRWAVSHE